MTKTRVSRTKPIELDAGDRDLMPESTFLQIQSRGDSASRMLELPPGPVRIGRGAHCEVRLAEPELGDVQCLLRRRGNNWHYQPVGPTGHVWIDGRAADQQRPLSLGVPFRVGDHWLTLRPADSATNDWDSIEEPISVVIEAAPPPEESNSGPSTGPDRSRPASSAADYEERLRRWQARLEQRERWLKDRQDERRWEARWKSAGESIRARSTSTSSTAPTTPRTAPTPPPVPPPRPTARAAQTPPVARIIEPRPLDLLRRVAEAPSRLTTTRVPTSPVNEPPSPIRGPVEPPTVRVTIKPARLEIQSSRAIEPKPETAGLPITRALVTLPVPKVDWSIARVLPAKEAATVVIEAEQEAPALPIEPVVAIEAVERLDATDSPLLELRPADSEVEVDPVQDVLEEVSPIAPSLFETESIEQILSEALEPVVEIQADRVESRSSEKPSVREDASIWMAEPPAREPEPARPAEVAPRTVAPAIPEHGFEKPVIAEPEPRLNPLGVGLSNAEWPSARAIFAAQGKRPQPVQATPKTSRRKVTEPLPTDSLSPAQWTLSLWLGWFPTLLIVLVVGPAGFGLAYGWSVESNSANQAIKLALRSEGSPGSSIDPAALPRGGWWSSNANHLAAWALALERASDGEDHSEDIRSLLGAARQASPLSSRSRFVIEPVESMPEAEGSSDFSHLGRTRDLVTLASTGRRLRKAGKLEASLRAYRSAMEIASKAARHDLDAPVFSEDQRIRRYDLPHEALIGLVVLDMVAAGEWTSEQWTGALPPTATATLSASRVLARSQQRAVADRLADLAIQQAASTPPPGFDPAEHRAAGAEALAYRGRWTDAAEQYRQAIDQADDDVTRRMWWLNLAEVYQRLNDDSGRARAIEAAKSPDSIDKVTRRAMEFQQGLPGIGPSGPRR